MRRLFTFACFFLATLPLAAQTLDGFLLRTASGTAANPGPAAYSVRVPDLGRWTTFRDGSVFLTHVTEYGPPEARSEVFSTNWYTFGALRSTGNRGSMMVRVRGSLEPLTIKEQGYPQLLQEISAESGGPAIDRMRAHDLVGEVALAGSLHAGPSEWFLYAAPVGDPPVGPVPFAQRASAREFAEAPFAYDVQESFHSATRVATGGVAFSFLTLEGGVFHHAVTTGRHSSIDDGGIDSRAARLTVTPHPNVSIQISRAELTDTEREVNSTSISWASERGAVTALWTGRDSATLPGVELTAYGLEGMFRITPRNTFMVRLESADRARIENGVARARETSHFAVGYIFDFLMARYRGGIGVNVDYHTRTKYEVSEEQYGHKPQSIFLFARLRLGK